MAKKNEACKSNRHCVDWGFCQRCQPEFAAKVTKKWRSMDIPEGEESATYERAIEMVKWG